MAGWEIRQHAALRDIGFAGEHQAPPTCMPGFVVVPEQPTCFAGGMNADHEHPTSCSSKGDVHDDESFTRIAAGRRAAPAFVASEHAGRGRPEGATDVADSGTLGNALVTAGLLTLDAQAEALGLSRSTTWTILQASHKASGLSAAIVDRMLASPRLPPRARVIILEYVAAKAAGAYGGSKAQRRKFAARLSMSAVGPTVLEEIRRGTARDRKRPDRIAEYFQSTNELAPLGKPERHGVHGKVRPRASRRVRSSIARAQRSLRSTRAARGLPGHRG